MNALKSGIDAESSIIPGEDAAALAALTGRFHRDCQPQSEIESILVDDIVRDTWLLGRFARIDAQLLRSEERRVGKSVDLCGTGVQTCALPIYRDCQPQSEIESILVDDIVRDTWLLGRFARIDAQLLIYKIEDTNYPSPNAPIGKAFDHSSTTQSRLQRRINDTRRLRLQSIKELRLIQAQRPQPQPQPPAPQPVENEPAYQPIGFVPPTHVSEPDGVPASPSSSYARIELNPLCATKQTNRVFAVVGQTISSAFVGSF